MKKAKKFLHFTFYIMILILTLYIVLLLIAPEKIDKILGYKFYIVLTNSMEPRIPTYSLACIKTFTKDEPVNLKSHEIITFHANRFGQNIIITHHFNKTEIAENGEIIYRTNAEGTDSLDEYKTTKDDLIGTYIFHIPYIGKILLFLKSKFGFILYGELLVIFLINSLIKAYKEDKDNSQNLNM